MNRSPRSARRSRKHQALLRRQRHARRVQIEVLERRVVFSVNASPFPPVSWTPLVNGMPILDSYAAAPASIFLDFDGDAGTGIVPYDTDGTPATFGTAEQGVIVETWRHMGAYFSMFNVNVTTIQPNVGAEPTAWIVIGANTGGTYSGVDAFPNTGPVAFQVSSDLPGRISATAHEIGHDFGNWHTSAYDLLGYKMIEYVGEFDALHGPLMGLDYTGKIHKWTWGHASADLASGVADPRTSQDEMGRIASDLNAIDGAGDGYRPDDQTGISVGTATAMTVVDSLTQGRIGIVERLTDQDWWSFTSAGGTYNIMVGRDNPSGVDAKVSVYNSSGTLLAMEDGDPRNAVASTLTSSMVNDTHLTMNLPAGTFYVKVESHGNYSDQGQYIARVDKIENGWKSDSIGYVGVPGYANYNPATDTYTVVGGGLALTGYHDKDEAQYVYQTLKGNGSITVKVETQENTNSFAMAGIMFRKTLETNAKHAGLVMTPNQGFQWIRRTGGGSNATFTDGSNFTFTPYWLRITRTVNGSNVSTLRAYTSTDGVNWTQFGSSVNITFSSGSPDVLVGMVVGANHDERLSKATFSHVHVEGVWQTQQIAGAAVPAGSSSFDDATGTYTLSGSGGGWGGVPTPGVNDTSNFQYQKLTGDGSIIARITDTSGPTAIATAGIAMRESLNYDSKYFAMWAYPNNGLWRNRRNATGGDSGGSTSVFAGSDPTPIWARITRTGNSFSSWYSSDGVNWTQLGTAQTVTMGTEVYVGLMAASGDTTSLNTATFTNVSFTGLMNVGLTLNTMAAPTGLAAGTTTTSTVDLSWTNQTGETGYSIERSTDGVHYGEIATTAVDVASFQDTGLLEAQTYFYRIRAIDAAGVSNPSAAVNALTRAGLAGNLRAISYSPTQIVLDWTDTSGEVEYKIQRSTDGVNFSSIATLPKNTPMYTDSGLTAGTLYYYRIKTQEAAGLQVATTTPISVYTRVNSAPTGLTFTSRTSSSMTLQWNALAGMTHYAVYRNQYGDSYAAWQLLDSNVLTNSYTDNTVSSLQEYHYMVVGYNAAGAASLRSGTFFGASTAVNPLPSPWLQQDVGSVGGPGATGLNSGAFTMLAAGDNIGGDASDEFRFTYVPMTGNGSITARVVSAENTNWYAKAGVMIRDTLTPGSKYGMTMIMPGGDSVFERRTTTNSATTGVTVGPLVSYPYWVRLTISGSTLTSQISADGSSWTTVGTATVSMTGTNYVGLALSSLNDVTLNTAVFDNVTTTPTGLVTGGSGFAAMSLPSRASRASSAAAAMLEAISRSAGSSGRSASQAAVIDRVFAELKLSRTEAPIFDNLMESRPQAKKKSAAIASNVFETLGRNVSSLDALRLDT